MKALLLVLLASTALVAQPMDWDYSTLPMIPQPLHMNWSQLHVLPVLNGHTAVASSRWDWPPVALYDSSGQQLWCNCGDELSVEMRRPFALGLFYQPSGFVAMFYVENGGDPEIVYGQMFGGSATAQAIHLARADRALYAAFDGSNSYFLCRNVENPQSYFVGATTSSGELWRTPLHGDLWTDVPIHFALSAGHGAAYISTHSENDSQSLTLRVIDATGQFAETHVLDETLIHTPVMLATDNVSGCWVIGMEDPTATNTDLYLYYSEDQTYHVIPLGIALPPIDLGTVPTLHAVPFGNGILIAGEATLLSGEECLFTLAYSANGNPRVDLIHGFTRLLDVAGAENYNFTAAVRATSSSDIQLLRAYSLVSSAHDIQVAVPISCSLSAYPNPFNPETTLQFDLPLTGLATLKIYDVLGREIETLLNKNMTAGTHVVHYNAASLSSGVYFARLIAGSGSATHKLLLLK
ncbi:MAG: T9SS type A sorting domain-containing protein [Calditrichaeota bacterium]|nr:T9SS type A sorting domain-containing protein [Calditrichota bacterium]MCB9369204.1 T9SS type A sorting domain-containing protein [Calditrichota bacterium]